MNLNLLLLITLIIFQVTISLLIYFSHVKSTALYLSCLVINLLMGLVITYYLGIFIWGVAVDAFHLNEIKELLYQPLNLATLLAVLATFTFPLMYFKYVCIPLIRDASQSLNNVIRSREQAKKERQQHASPRGHKNIPRI